MGGSAVMKGRESIFLRIATLNYRSEEVSQCE